MTKKLTPLDAARRLNEAVIREHELTHTLRLAQEAQTPRPTPVVQPLQPQVPRAPGVGVPPSGIPQPNTVPHPHAEPPKKASEPVSCTSRNTVIFQWSTQRHFCLQCANPLFHASKVDEVLRLGRALGSGSAGWLGRILVRETDSARCSVCQRRIG
jgi:hypothetical protein